MKAIMGVIYLRDVTLITGCWRVTRWVPPVLTACCCCCCWERAAGTASPCILWVGLFFENYSLASFQNVGSFLLARFLLMLFFFFFLLLKGNTGTHTLNPPLPGSSSRSILIYLRHEEFRVSLGAQDCSPITHSSFPPKSPGDLCYLSAPGSVPAAHPYLWRFLPGTSHPTPPHHPATKTPRLCQAFAQIPCLHRETPSPVKPRLGCTFPCF